MRSPCLPVIDSEVAQTRGAGRSTSRTSLEMTGGSECLQNKKDQENLDFFVGRAKRSSKETKFGGPGGTRTHTPLGQKILSLSCIPFHHRPALKQIMRKRYRIKGLKQ